MINDHCPSTHSRRERLPNKFVHECVPWRRKSRRFRTLPRCLGVFPWGCPVCPAFRDLDAEHSSRSATDQRMESRGAEDGQRIVDLQLGNPVRAPRCLLTSLIEYFFRSQDMIGQQIDLLDTGGRGDELSNRRKLLGLQIHAGYQRNSHPYTGMHVRQFGQVGQDQPVRNGRIALMLDVVHGLDVVKKEIDPRSNVT